MDILPKHFEKQFYSYLNNLNGQTDLSDLSDLEKLEPSELLKLAHKISPKLLPLFVHLLKSSEQNIFHRLMGEHDLANKPLVDSFFSKYSEEILAQENQIENFNPLITYLPKEVLNDLSFVQSREAFFKRQTADVINEYLEDTFTEKTHFIPGQNQEAWHFFWNQIIKL